MCVCVCDIFFIHSSIFGHLGCFRILAIVNSTENRLVVAREEGGWGGGKMSEWD